MDNTIEKNIWDSSVWTFSNNGDEESLVEQYKNHFDKINLRANILEKGNFLFNSRLKDNSEKEYLNHLIDYKIPRQDLLNNFLIRNYAQKFTKLKGYVTAIENDYFVAEMYQDSDLVYEIGEFDISDIDRDDLGLLKVGAIFYWTFGYFIFNGQVKKQSELRFQRLPNLTSKEVDNILDESSDLNKSLDWD